MEAIINNRYRIIGKIKEKVKSKIYKGFDLKDNREVAIKVVDLKKATEKDISRLKNEINTFNKIDSKYSLKFY